MLYMHIAKYSARSKMSAVEQMRSRERGYNYAHEYYLLVPSGVNRDSVKWTS